VGDLTLDASLEGPPPVAVVMCHPQVSFPFRVTRKVLCASSRAPYKTTPRGRALEAGWRLSRPSRGRACAAPRRICAVPSTSLPRR